MRVHVEFQAVMVYMTSGLRQEGIVTWEKVNPFRRDEEGRNVYHIPHPLKGAASSSFVFTLMIETDLSMSVSIYVRIRECVVLQMNVEINWRMLGRWYD